MKKNIFIKIFVVFFVLFTVTVNVTKGQNKYDRKSYHLQEEILYYVSKLNNDSSNEHRVFVIYVYKNDTSNNSFCFTLSYIYNVFKYKNLSPKYLFKINDELFCIINEDSCDIEIFKSYNPIKIEKEQDDLIIKKLDTGITYRPVAMQYCWEYDFYELKIYQNGDWVPENECIEYEYILKNKPKN